MVAAGCVVLEASLDDHRSARDTLYGDGFWQWNVTANVNLVALEAIQDHPADFALFGIILSLFQFDYLDIVLAPTHARVSRDELSTSEACGRFRTTLNICWASQKLLQTRSKRKR
jgi:hypothetical protein